jgi:hypothetical protein
MPVLYSLISQVDAERTYHQSAASILDKLHDEVFSSYKWFDDEHSRIFFFSFNMFLIWAQMILAKEQSGSLAQSRAIGTISEPKSITEGPEPMKAIQNNGNGQANGSFEAEVLSLFQH